MIPHRIGERKLIFRYHEKKKVIHKIMTDHVSPFLKPAKYFFLKCFD